ncbi:1-deoxy-D-xylulose-5-phosphate reductoisomerase [Propionibacterium cyclohexanicum]|uniref:1-deoxy-D-xylulose 5-phosphate reductoisomerase n=1 Tax=Propionibacterium cyclohexanicum TaxID=64702 RepID=A0A1H9PN07_9ACTN|nr:1-deoxy-D-xylulose-5-phosphate reductoisomerase [Propionibacterium cyclohexanicum]
MLLGSTGSIGTQACEVIAGRRNDFRLVALGAHGDHLAELARQAVRFDVPLVGIAQPGLEDAFWAEFAAAGGGRRPELRCGPQANAALAASPADVVLNAITGSAGLLATLATLRAGTTLALANKESLVIGGRLVTEAAAPGQLVAVDSEHSAFAQCLRGGGHREVRRLILTASGGPFRGMSRAQLRDVTPDQALAHPTWRMGRVITINSATLVNKGLELLEAALLYDVGLDDIQVVVHPQSIVHSGVEFCDGATILQASPPDMKLPIGLALTWPARMPDVASACDWTRAANWTFEPLDSSSFPAVELAREAGRSGGTAPAVLNGANEVCVDAFCAGQIGFLDIAETIGEVLDRHLGTGHRNDAQLSVDEVLEADRWARAHARELCDRRSR